MDRRSLILLLALVVFSPQNTVGEPRLGKRKVVVITNYSDKDPDALLRVKRFTDAMKRLSGRPNAISYEYIWVGGDIGRIKDHAKTAVTMNPDVIFAATTPVVAALLQETRRIPIVFVTVSDPVGSGFVESLRHPGRNATGFINTEASLASKWVQLLKELLPSTSCMAMMFNPMTAPHSGYFLRPFKEAAESLHIRPIVSPVHDKQDIENLMKALAADQCGLILMNDSFNFVHRHLISRLSEEYRVPTMAYNKRAGAEEALVSYGPDDFEANERAAGYVSQILNGSHVGDLPVQLESRFYLTLNLRKAKALRIDIPETFRVQVDEEIE